MTDGRIKGLPGWNFSDWVDTEGWQIRKELLDAAAGKDVTIIDKPTFGSMTLMEKMKALQAQMDAEGLSEENP